MRLSVLGLAFFLSFPAAGRAQVAFQRDIRPILARHCLKCHGPALQEGGLRLDSRERALRRKVVVPGMPQGSRMLTRVQADDDDERMPPPETGDRLKPGEIDLLRRWIAEGAEYTPHWAFVAPTRSLPPRVRQEAWPRNGLDRFLLARLEKEDIQPSSEADRFTLIRRLSLDLLGLLPTPAEVDAFVGDSRPDAYERLVDRLLASPHYGERQARHWLDLARYADSNGYTIDGPRSIWPWRDWVIAAFNRDLPFDQFTVEQLAGDLLPGATRDQVVATGFHRNTSFNEEGGTSPEQFRVERTVDRTNTTGSVWLGLTVGCAQCHDHKYDPISQKDYYQLYAFFDSLDEPKLSLPTDTQQARLDSLRTELARARSEPAHAPARADLDGLLATLEKEMATGWRAIYPKSTMAERGTKLTVLDDRSVLISPPRPESDTYILQSIAPETGTLSAIRVEVWPAADARTSGSEARFAVGSFTFETDGLPRPFRPADASPFVPAEAGGQEATFRLEHPLPVREGQAYTFTLRFAGPQLPERLRISATCASERFLQLPLAAQRILTTDKARRGPGDMDRLFEALKTTPLIRPGVDKLQAEIQTLEGEIASSMVLSERKTPRITHLHKRGDFLAPGAVVQPDVFAVLPPLPKHPATRLDLARWLVAPGNPLTARVVVNRVWQQYFGKGLVETENDFGVQGSLPTHPELLDWLALEFADRGWRMKDLHRLIVTSATYRQSSKYRGDLRDVDPDNKLLARQNRLRLEAEILRDAALSASGLLTRRLGGPGVYPPQPPEIFAFTQNQHPWPESTGADRYRRGMYTFLWRQSQHPLLTTFDGPDAQTACTRRNRSNTPLQALHLANDPTFIEFARGLADRLAHEASRDDSARLDHAFRICLCRTPTPAERARLLTYLEEQRGASPAESWARVARVLMNLDEFVTRE